MPGCDARGFSNAQSPATYWIAGSLQNRSYEQQFGSRFRPASFCGCLRRQRGVIRRRRHTFQNGRPPPAIRFRSPDLSRMVGLIKIAVLTGSRRFCRLTTFLGELFEIRQGRGATQLVKCMPNARCRFGLPGQILCTVADIVTDKARGLTRMYNVPDEEARTHGWGYGLSRMPLSADLRHKHTAGNFISQ